MKFRIIISIQVLLLASAVLAGNVLNGDTVDGPRDLHRLSGTFAGAWGLFALVAAFIHKLSNRLKLLSGVTAALTLLAAGAGTKLSDAVGDEYDDNFQYMRLFGTLALVVAIVTLTQVMTKSSATKDTQTQESTEKEAEEKS